MRRFYGTRMRNANLMLVMFKPGQLLEVELFDEKIRGAAVENVKVLDNGLDMSGVLPRPGNRRCGTDIAIYWSD